MKNNVSEKTENMKTVLGDTALKSKEAVKEIIHLNTRLLNEALESNKVLVNGIRDQFQLSDKNTSLFSAMNKTFGKSIELSEETIDHVLDSYNTQVKLYLEHNTKLIDAIKESATFSANNEGLDKVLKLVKENFESAVNTMNTSTQAIIESYNKHTSLALNFNKKIAETISSQFHNYNQIQQNSMKAFSGWASEWWKHSDNK